jgi:TRAP-type C4-dicarboxylate transport system permease small subunit
VEEGHLRPLKYVLTFRWANTLSELSGYLSAVALVLATLAMMHGVLSRYLLGRPTVWQTEVSIYLLVFVTFVGAAYGLKHHAHVGVDLLVERLPVRGQLVVRLVTALMSLVVVLAVVWTASGTWWEAVEGSFHSPTALRAPLSVVYAILPLGMLLVACQYIAFVIEGVQGLLDREGVAESVALLGQRNAELAAVQEMSSTGPATLGGPTTDGPAPGSVDTEERRRP